MTKQLLILTSVCTILFHKTIDAMVAHSADDIELSEIKIETTRSKKPQKTKILPEQEQTMLISLETNLQKGADPNALHVDRFSTLYHAVVQKKILLAQLFLKYGADPNIIYHNGLGVLHQATANGDVGMVKLLLEKGAQPNLANTTGGTPLHMAVMKNQYEIVKLLLAHGADSNARSSERITPLDLAKKNQNMLKLLQTKEDKKQKQSCCMSCIKLCF